MIKVFTKHKEGKDIFFPIYDCYDIVDNLYEVNPETGEVRVIATKETIKPLNSQGYKLVSLFTKRNSPRRYQVHRIVASMFVFQPEGKEYVNHRNGIRDDNNYQNLEWCTIKENNFHARYTGLYQGPCREGESNGNSILKNSEVHEICRLMCEGMSYPDILRTIRLPVTQKMLDILTKIRTKQLWTIISDQYPIPEPRAKSAETRYEDEVIREICGMIMTGMSNREIAIKMEIDVNNKRHMDKFYKFLNRIRRRETYENISKDYNW